MAVKISLLALAVSLAGAVVQNCDDIASDIQSVENPVWDQKIYTLGPLEVCKVDTDEDIMINWISEVIVGEYYQYEPNEFQICTAVGDATNFYSGETLLSDFDKICKYSIEITN
jgi:hypothetical protein